MRWILAVIALTLTPASKSAEETSALPVADYLASKYGLTEYRQAKYDLNGDGSLEHIILATSFGWCGATGGCTMFILRNTDGEPELISKTTIVHTPVRVLNSRTNGWSDLEVRARKDAFSSWRAKLVFDGCGYTSNPTMSPAEGVSGLPGETILDSIP